MSVQLPIPASQVVDVQVTLPACLTVECLTLNNVLQALADAVCNTDLPTLDFLCLDAVSTTPEFYQLIVNTLCSLQTAVAETEVEPTYQLCDSDAWDCSSELKCIDLGVLENNTQNVLQGVVDRTNAYSVLFTSLCARIDTLETTVESLQTQIDTINTNCCS